MADITLRDVRNQPAPSFSHSSPYGNATALMFALATTSGIVDGGSSDAAAAAGDVVALGMLPGGMRLDSLATVVSTILVGNGKVGFRYADGVDDVNVPEADDYFTAAVALGAAARVAGDGAAAVVTLPKDAFLIVTVDAGQTETGLAEFIVNGVLTGKDE